MQSVVEGFLRAAVRPAAMAGGERHSLVRRKADTPIIRLEGDWETYLASRPKHLQREVRRKSRKLEANWEVAWSTVSDAAAQERDQLVLAVVHENRFAFVKIP